MADYNKQHKWANALYEAYFRALEEALNNAKEELEGSLRQYLGGINTTAPIFLKTNTIFPPIPIPFYPLDVSLFGFSEKGINHHNGLRLDPYFTSIYSFEHKGSAYYLLYEKNYQFSTNKAILPADEPLYLKLKKKVIEWTKSQDTKFNKNDDIIRFFDALVKEIQKAIKEEGIDFKNVDRNKGEYPPFLSKEGAKDFFVCIHQALLNNILIKQVIEELPIKGIEVLSLNHFAQTQYNGEYIGEWHRNNLLVDAKSGKIIAIVEASGLYQPTKPITIEQLLEERHILAKKMHGGQYQTYYLPNRIDRSSRIQLYQGGPYVEKSLFREHFRAKVRADGGEHLPDFSFQNLEGRDFSNQNLSGALFIGANLKGADLRGAIFNQKTILPENLIKNPPTFPFSKEQINSLRESEAAKAEAFNESIPQPTPIIHMKSKTNSPVRQVG